jgi:hypothetical protein
MAYDSLRESDLAAFLERHEEVACAVCRSRDLSVAEKPVTLPVWDGDEESGHLNMYAVVSCQKCFHVMLFAADYSLSKGAMIGEA